jgi:hypothetical protein
MKVVAYSFNGVQPIDSNTAFTSEVLAAAPGKKYILMCEAGGTMRQSVNFPMVCFALFQGKWVCGGQGGAPTVCGLRFRGRLWLGSSKLGGVGRCCCKQ